MKTQKQQEVIKFLNDLVCQRFNEETLNQKLSKFFNEEIQISDATVYDGESTDINYMFNSERQDTYGYFDIYALNMLNTGFDGANFYVTEISYEFE